MIIDRYLHGTFTAYQRRGCRCDRCRTFMANYFAERRATVAGSISRKKSDPRHGTVYGYTHLRCRCDRCRDAVRTYRREWRQRRAATA